MKVPKTHKSHHCLKYATYLTHTWSRLPKYGRSPEFMPFSPHKCHNMESIKSDYLPII